MKNKLIYISYMSLILIFATILCTLLDKCENEQEYENIVCEEQKNIDIYDIFFLCYELERDSITIDNIKNILMALDCQHIDIVIAKSILETGYYTSNLVKTNNNLFGMKYPKNRPTLAIGNKNGYAYYKNWTYSVIDYCLWQRKYSYNICRKHYLEKLSSYSEDKEYIKKINNIINKLNL